VWRRGRCEIGKRLYIINGVARAKGGNVAYKNLGPRTFRKPKNASFDETLWAVNGHPAIQVADEHGKQFILLDRLKNQWNDPRDKENGRYALYVEWKVPADPAIPARQHGAIVRVRHNSTDEQIAAGKWAETDLRAIPEDDPDFPDLGGIRQLAESLNHNMKQRRPNKRARAYGLDNRTVHNYAFIMASNLVNMIQWYRYTGGDTSSRFGHYEPPEPTRKSKRPSAS